ncbi:MAG: hypothetical protein F6K40_25330 [Okeania sp. SIO3I5]|uniref:hypothetical protein n=1 Tax=Okeania sp. SIO3I5 TaxID=2607805 RepID=UPI0013B672B2|nr:hypothetical protein [Okeania sp. SIO3I5]NEQ39396.1 hypothetical protein [Okeania sp. SIO3I5]
MAPTTRSKKKQPAAKNPLHKLNKKNGKKIIKAVAKVAHKKAWSKGKNPHVTSSTFSYIQENGKWVYKGRPQWYVKTVEDIKLQRGEHRRHIIPSHLLLSSFLNYVNDNSATIESKVNAFITKRQKVDSKTSPIHKVSISSSLDKKLEAVSTYIHNNQKNLFPERGDENTAIGFLPKEIGNLLKNAEALLKVEYDNAAKAHPKKDLSNAQIKKITQKVVDYIENELQGLKKKGFGFVLPVKADILDKAIAYIQAMLDKNYARVTAFLADEIVPSLEIDLSKTPELANQNQKVIEIFQKLDKLRNGEGGDIDFFQVIDEFLSLPQK